MENAFDSAFNHEADADGAGNSVDVNVRAVEVDAVFRGVADKALLGADTVGDLAHCAGLYPEFLADTVAAACACFATVGFAVVAGGEEDTVLYGDRAPASVGADTCGGFGDFARFFKPKFVVSILKTLHKPMVACGYGKDNFFN